MNSQGIKHISECYIKPKYEVHEAKNPYYLSPWDLVRLSTQYNQKGLLFTKPDVNQDGLFSMEQLLESLKDSLSLTLVHFYPLAGQLATIVDHGLHRSLVFVGCNKGPGARFVHATLDATVSDILSPTDNVPTVVKFFFDHHNGEVNYDGCTRPLLTIQVTELVDGLFIGCSMNHAIADGTSFWHFWNVWSEIHEGARKPLSISRLPTHNRWIPEGYGPNDLFLPYVYPDEFIVRHEPPSKQMLRERFFHFSSKNVATLKAKANKEMKQNGDTTRISSFQALIALIWRSIVRARGLEHTQVTHCKLSANNRSRLDPPLSQEYFGNALSTVKATAKVGELLQHGIGWVASLLNQVVADHNDEAVRGFFREWLNTRLISNLGPSLEANDTVKVGSSPRFRVYENRFTKLGKPIAVRSGGAYKYGGKVIAFPGYEGEGSVDLEICLPPDSMSALELDEEFIAYVSLPSYESYNHTEQAMSNGGN